MEGTRLRIIQILQRDESQTVDSLAKTLELAPATIRRHLDILQRDHLVAYQEVRKRTGRPEYSFYLTEPGQEILPKRYDELLASVIREISELDLKNVGATTGQDILDEVFQQLARKVAAPYVAGSHGKGLKDRLQILMEYMKDEDLLPEADITNGDLVIKVNNCPYRSVAFVNTAVCRVHESVVSSVLDLKVTHDKSISKGAPSCLYTAILGQTLATSNDTPFTSLKAS